MDVTVSIDDKLYRNVRLHAEASGMSVEQLIADCLQEIVASREAAEFERLSWASQGSRQNWKFSRDELHERR